MSHARTGEQYPRDRNVEMTAASSSRQLVNRAPRAPPSVIRGRRSRRASSPAAKRPGSVLTTVGLRVNSPQRQALPAAQPTTALERYKSELLYIQRQLYDYRHDKRIHEKDLATYTRRMQIYREGIELARDKDNELIKELRETNMLQRDWLTYWHRWRNTYEYNKVLKQEEDLVFEIQSLVTTQGNRESELVYWDPDAIERAQLIKDYADYIRLLETKLEKSETKVKEAEDAEVEAKKKQRILKWNAEVAKQLPTEAVGRLQPKASAEPRVTPKSSSSRREQAKRDRELERRMNNLSL